MTPPCPICKHPQGTHNYSYGCQRKDCFCQEYTKKAMDPSRRFNINKKGR